MRFDFIAAGFVVGAAFGGAALAQPVSDTVAPLPPRDLGCIALTAAAADISPFELALSVQSCAAEDRMEAAAPLFLLMIARGTFDLRRVADISAHPQLGKLRTDLAATLTPAQLSALQTHITAINADPASPAFAALCQSFAALGTPTHDAYYMVSTGIVAQKQVQEPPYLAGFAGDAAWSGVLHDYMSCPK